MYNAQVNNLSPLPFYRSYGFRKRDIIVSTDEQYNLSAYDGVYSYDQSSDTYVRKDGKGRLEKDIYGGLTIIIENPDPTIESMSFSYDPERGFESPVELEAGGGYVQVGTARSDYAESVDEPDWDSRKWYSWGQVYPLLSPSWIIPFFLDMEEGEVLTGARLYRMCDKSGTEVSRDDFEKVSDPRGDWLESLRQFGLTEEGGKVVYTPRLEPLLDMGFYYIEFLTNRSGHTYVSEIFKVVDNVTDKVLSLKWWNYDNIVSEEGVIPYVSAEGLPLFHNKIYVSTSLGLPTYEFEEEGEKRMGYFYPTKQISYKKYRFTFFAPEYLCDVLRLVPMSDRIEVSDGGGSVMRPTEFNVDFKWLDGGHYAQVDCEFTTNSVVKKTGGMSKFVREGKDFNDDYNKDYK